MDSSELIPGASQKPVTEEVTSDAARAESLVEEFRNSPPVRSLMERLAAGARSLRVEGIGSPASSLLALALAEGRTLVLLVGSQEAGERAADAIAAFMSPGRLSSTRIAPQDSSPASLWFLMGHSSAFLEEGNHPSSTTALSDRLAALDCLASSRFCLVIATVAGALQYTYSPEEMRQAILDLAPGKEMDLKSTLYHLVRTGYQRADQVQQRGEFAARGGILDIFPANGPSPVRIDLFGDQVESIRTFDPVSQRSTGSLGSIRILPACEPLESASHTLLDYLPGSSLFLVEDAPALQHRWKEFEGEVRDQLQALNAGKEDEGDGEGADGRRQGATGVWRDGSRKGQQDSINAWEEQTGDTLARPGGSFPFLPLSGAIPKLESFQAVFVSQLSRTVPWGRPQAVISLTSEPAPHFQGDMEALAARIHEWREHQVYTWLFSHQWPRLAELLRARGLPVLERGGRGREESSGSVGQQPGNPDARSPVRENQSPGPNPPPSHPHSRTQDPGSHPPHDSITITVAPGSLSEGFFIPSARLAVLSDAEIFGGKGIQRSRRTSRDSAPLTSLLELKPGDMVVHVDQGIGYFRGLKTMEVEGVRRDYLHLEYAQGDKLFVPVDQMARVQRYIGSEDHPPAVHRLGGGEWARTKRKVREAVQDMAEELLALYAARSTRDGYAAGPDTPWQNELEEAFVYEETNDQLKAIRDVKQDLESDKPMDRLICGDVGYGKTEVAIRAAFKMVMEGKQVAVLVPTTVLAQQHLNTFTERLSGFPVRVEMLSRFRSRKEQLAVVEALKAGSVDIVIGTHRLLSKDVGFKELGLVIVDEEQRFGVANKERLKQLRQLVDVLTLTATPIPRTLHMALSTIRDMSVMNQAPEGRTAIRTYLREYSDDLVRQCLLRELERDGQVYFVHNRIETLPQMVETLRRLVPQARIAMGHGQMPENDLEQVMLDFYERRYDVLCCTTIIESGLDIPNVNTICVNDADRMGLAQLYQLRGRVGRSNRQAYCYLLFHPDKELTELAQKRLHALREFTDLGSGFRIALRDLEIRGAGNLLGAEQHGAMMSVGFDLYCQMIAEAVRTLKNEPPPPPPLPPVDLPISAFIPGDYIAAESLRVDFYKRFGSTQSAEEIVALQEEMQDRFGPLPPAVRNLLAILRLRLQCREVGAASIVPEKDQVVIRLGNRLRLAPSAIASLQNKHRNARFLADRIIVPVGKRGALVPVTEILDSLQAMRARRKAMGVG